jgi:hydrogenase maturation protein HypF
VDRAIKREIVVLGGRVQTVGFRDAVLRVAARHPVAGTVRNLRDGAHLEIDVEGDVRAIDAFVDDVLANPPRFAQVETVTRTPAEPRGATRFEQGSTR